MNDIEAKLESQTKIRHEATEIANDISRGTTRREKYPFLKLADKHTAEAAGMDFQKLQKRMDIDALMENIERTLRLRAEELAQVSAEQNDQDGLNPPGIPIPGETSPDRT